MAVSVYKRTFQSSAFLVRDRFRCPLLLAVLALVLADDSEGGMVTLRTIYVVVSTMPSRTVCASEGGSHRSWWWHHWHWFLRYGACRFHDEFGCTKGK